MLGGTGHVCLATCRRRSLRPSSIGCPVAAGGGVWRFLWGPRRRLRLLLMSLSLPLLLLRRPRLSPLRRLLFLLPLRLLLRRPPLLLLLRLPLLFLLTHFLLFPFPPLFPL